MTMRKTILGSLIVLISLISCESQKEEDFRISLNYEHPKQQEYPEANFRSTKPVLPYKHHINVKDFIQKNLYDETTLDSDLKGTVEVPVDVELDFQTLLLLGFTALQPALLLFLFLSTLIILVKWLKRKLLIMKQSLLKPTYYHGQTTLHIDK